MRLKEPLLLGFTLFLVTATAVALVYPPIDDLWVENPYWNGLSEFYTETHPARIHRLERLSEHNPMNTTLFIIGPSQEFTPQEVEAIQNYLQGGGRVVVLDETGSGNSLLEGLGLKTRFNGALLKDQVFFNPSPEFPQATNQNLEKAITLNYATILNLNEPHQALLESGLTSYIQEDETNTTGPFTIAALINYQGGELVLVSDSSIWLNSMINRGANKALIAELLRGKALIDVGHSHPTLLLSLKWKILALYTLFKTAELRYLLVLTLSLTIYWALKPKQGGEDEVEELLKRHPNWDREDLERLRKRIRET